MGDAILATAESTLPESSVINAKNSALMLTPRGHLECRMFLHPTIDLSSLRAQRKQGFVLVEVHSAKNIVDSTTIVSQVERSVQIQHNYSAVSSQTCVVR